MQNKPHWALAAAAPALFVLLLILESAFPLRKRKRPVLHRFVVNAILSALVFLAGSLVVKPVAVRIAGWASGRPFGLLHLAPLPFKLRFVLGFLLMDLTFYLWHRVNHEVPLLWRFHNVHHADPDLDVTTSFRFHFVEILYSTVFRILQVGLLGIDVATYILYEIVFTCATVFHHSNLRLPIRFERILNRVFVTPRMHGIHHSAVKEETNANYSVIFRWWDRLSGSLRLNVHQSEITIGVPGYLVAGDNDLWNLAVLPFRRQRDYWRLPDDSRPQRPYQASKTILLK